MEKFGRVVRDLRGAFVYSSGYLEKDSNEIKKRIRQRLAETNCKRILAMFPVFLTLILFHLISLLLGERHKLYAASLIAALATLTAVLVISAFALYVLYFNKVDNDREMWKCKVIYRIFWWTWLVGMATISFCRLLAGAGGGFYIITCIICCLVPLFGTKEFIGIVLIFMVIANGGLIYIDGHYEETEIILYTYIAMIIIGYVAQRFEVSFWTLQEYVYMKTFIDPLTGLLNRRGGNAVLEEEMKKRNGTAALGVVMLDIDFFKKYNDTLGHDEGDVCLCSVSRCIKEAVSERTKLLIRHGGEEFVALFLDATEEEVRHLAEKIRSSVYSMGLEAPHKQVADVVTVSVGATLFQANKDFCYENTLKTADLALYEAKEKGRNQVVFKG